MNQHYYPRNHSASAGLMLAQAREELELTVSDVARHLKISPAQVEALEAGAYERLPGRVFVRGFLRNYAKLLGVDPQPLLRSIEREMPQPAPVEDPMPSSEVIMPRGEGAGWPLYVGIVAMAIVGALAVYEFGFNETPGGPNGSQTPAGQEGAGAPGEPSDLRTPAGPAQAAPTSPTAAGQSNFASTPGLPLTPTRIVPDPSAGVPALAPLPAKAVQAAERELHFRFETESWVEIRDRDDKVIFSKLNHAGAEERFAAVPPLKLVVGNARGVRLNYANKPVDLTPHIGVTVARFTLQ